MKLTGSASTRTGSRVWKWGSNLRAVRGLDVTVTVWGYKPVLPRGRQGEVCKPP